MKKFIFIITLMIFTSAICSAQYITAKGEVISFNKVSVDSLFGAPLGSYAITDSVNYGELLKQGSENNKGEEDWTFGFTGHGQEYFVISIVGWHFPTLYYVFDFEFSEKQWEGYHTSIAVMFPEYLIFKKGEYTIGNDLPGWGVVLE